MPEMRDDKRRIRGEQPMPPRLDLARLEERKTDMPEMPANQEGLWMIPDPYWWPRQWRDKGD